MRRTATVLCDNGGYDLTKGEMNPAIVEEFVGLLLDSDLPPVVWEPFAGTGSIRFWNDAVSVNVRWIAHNLTVNDFRFCKADSTETGPGVEIGGAVFHPTYFGSPPLAVDDRDLGHKRTKEDYIAQLSKTIELTSASMVKSGLVCAVGRDYRIGGQRIRLDCWYLELFVRAGFKLVGVWLSEPDVVMIFRKEQ